MAFTHSHYEAMAAARIAVTAPTTHTRYRAKPAALDRLADAALTVGCSTGEGRRVAARERGRVPAPCPETRSDIQRHQT
jgi:hypothetical protein